MAQDWIPANQIEFREKINVTTGYIFDHKSALGFDQTTPNGKFFYEELLPAFTSYASTLDKWEIPETRTPAIVNELRLKREVVEPLYRKLALLLKGSLLVSDQDLFNMGIPPRKKSSGTPAPKADEPPAYTTELLVDHRVRLHLYDAKNVHKRGKPAGQHGVEVRWGVFPEAREVFPKELNRSSFDTRSPFTFELEAEDRGKFLYFTVRWENTRGEKGPSSPIDHVVIP